jgi:E3 ubiquitin-protein ligase HECTD1
MEVDPDTLLEWLQTGQSDERDMQLIALEQLCQILLLSDNIDHCFERLFFKVEKKNTFQNILT